MTEKTLNGMYQRNSNAAFDNAKKKNQSIGETDLIISRLTADSGPSLKRFRAASMGRASSIIKRTSHFTICLDMREGANVPADPGKQPRKRTMFKKDAGSGTARTKAAKKIMKGRA